MLGQKIRYLRKMKGYSLAEAAEKVGINLSYLSAIETGSKSSPSLSVMKKLSDLLDISIDILVDDNIKPDEISQMMGKQEHDQTPSIKIEDNIFTPEPEEVSIATIYGQANEDKGVLEKAIGIDCLPKSKAGKSKLFEFKMPDNSLEEKGIKRGDLVIARYQVDVNNGDIAVLSYNNQILVRRIFFTGFDIILSAFNKNFPPAIVQTYNDLRIIGKVLGAKIFF